MEISGILKPESQKFIEEHLRDDPVKLLLRTKEVAGVPIRDLVAQIKARKIINSKVPLWAGVPEIVYPSAPGLSLEQCSSQLTAKYKCSKHSGGHLVDLTGGLGVDSFFFSKVFDKVTFIERSPELCQVARHNFEVLGAHNIRVVHGEAHQVLSEIETPVDLIYVDPSRRVKGKRVFMLTDSEPSLTELLPLINQKAPEFLCKLSPLMDIQYLLKTVEHVKSIEVVSIKNDCKEVLLHGQSGHSAIPSIRATEILDADHVKSFSFNLKEEAESVARYGNLGKYLYEPFTSVLKIGAFKTLCQRYPVIKLHPNSHLYSSEELIKDFPGKVFQVVWSGPYKKRKIREQLKEGQANITSRNFPYSVAEIRKQTGIKAGGAQHLFATTTYDGKPKIICGIRI